MSNSRKNFDRDDSFRMIVNEIRENLDIKETKEKIVTIIGQLYNADRCYISEYDPNSDKFLAVEAEYLSSIDITSYKGLDLNTVIPTFAEEIKRGKQILIQDNEIILDTDSNNLMKERVNISKHNIKSAFGFPIIYQNNLLGVFSLHYTKEHHIVNSEIEFLNLIASQIAIAIHQSKLLDENKRIAENEKMLRQIMLSSAQSFDFKQIIQSIVSGTGILLASDRCFFVDYDLAKENAPNIENFGEYLSSPEIKSHTLRKVSKSDFEDFGDALNKNTVTTVEDVEKIDLPLNVKEMLRELSVKSYLIAPIYYEETLYGGIVLHYVNDYKNFTKGEIEIVRSVANQSAIIINQAKLYNKMFEQKEREITLRKIIEAINSSLDSNKMKDQILGFIGKYLNADRCFIVDFDYDNQQFLPIENEYLACVDEKSILGVDINKDFPKFVEKNSRNVDNIISDTEDLFNNSPPGLELEIEQLKKFNVKSDYGLPIINAERLIGLLVVHYTHQKKILTKEEFEMLENLAKSSGIALYQAKLFEAIQLQAEREKLSKNIIEILRSSLDLETIKHLFVVHIGRYLKANRVFFSVYDNDKKVYLPIDKNSEYLSSNKEKSFINFDFSDEAIRGFIQPILDKREVKIESWDDYIKEKSPDESFVLRFENANVKSSYNLPVIYQQRIMGYFCIEFTQKIVKLSDEDINRIRNMCTQAGVALYHATLYEEAQQCFQAKKSFTSEVVEQIKKPTEEILEESTLLSQYELERTAELEHLNQIIHACNQLLELTRDISQN